MIKNNIILQDAVIIRLLLILLLVLYHSFCIYTGGWSRPAGVQEIKAYWWIGSFAYSFMLEAFVFVSGYVFGFQASTKYLGIVDFKMCVAKKAKRLLIPCFVFSIIYLICFGTVSNNHWDGQIYHIVNGEGHLWFLPMLFLCFVCIYFIEKLKLPTKYVLPTAVIASVLSLLSLPFRLSETAYYFLFFYLGYIMRKVDIYRSVLAKNRLIILLSVIYILTFVVSKIIFTNVKVMEMCEISTIHKMLIFLVERISKLIYSLSGMLALFGAVNYLLDKSMINVSDTAVRYSGYCFGVYIFQQFILMPLVYNHKMITIFGTYWLPWVSFLIALVLSLVITKFFLRTSVGRFLIG